MGSSVAHSNWKELKVFSKKLDNPKNLCYNKYVRLREAQSDENPKTFSIPSTMRAWLELVYTADSKSVAARRASSNLAARTWQGRARKSVAARLPKISKEVNSKEIVDRRAATRRNRISLLPLFYLDVEQIKINLTFSKICAIITS